MLLKQQDDKNRYIWEKWRTLEHNQGRETIANTFPCEFKQGDWVVCFDENQEAMLAQVQAGVQDSRQTRLEDPDPEQPLQHWIRAQTPEIEEAGSEAIKNLLAKHPEGVYTYCTGCEPETLDQGHCHWREKETALFPATVKTTN